MLKYSVPKITEKIEVQKYNTKKYKEVKTKHLDNILSKSFLKKYFN